MASAAVIAEVQRIQAALTVVASVEFALWPRQDNVLNGSSYDYVIVGAGVAGCVLANRLTENKDVSVLLIEAGGDPHYETLFPGFLNYLQNTEMDYNYTAECDGVINRCHKSPRLKLHVGKVLGGSSSINSLVYYQGTPDDYQQWYEASNDTTWLYKNVLPYFKKTEKLNPMDINKYTKKFHGTKGYYDLSFSNKKINDKYLEAFKDVGNKILPDISGDKYIGYARPLTGITTTNYRETAAYAYLTPIMDRPNLYLRKNTLVTKILFRNKVAIGVRALTDKGKYLTIFAKKEVIIAAGVIKSPQLLMLSGIGPKRELQKEGIDVIADLPVGENYQDHTAIVVVHKTEKTRGPPPRLNPLEEGSGLVIGNVALNTSTTNFYQTLSYLFDDLKGMLQTCAIVFDFKNNICDQFYKQAKGKEVMFTTVLNINPKSRGKVSLKSIDPTDAPIVINGFYSEKEDFENSIKYVQDFLKIEQSEYFKRVGAEMIDPTSCKCGKYKRGSKAYWRCYGLCMTVSEGHYCGTCSMGSVVDGKLFVMGVKKLRVVDASVIPKITSGGTLPPTIIVAEKGADMIKQKWE